MNRRTILFVAAGAAAALLSGCTASTGSSAADGAFPSHQVGDETVFVAPYEVSAIAYPDVRALVEATPVIVIGTVVAANGIAAEVQAPRDQEGVLPGEGPDLYGTITFKVDSVVKGDVRGGSLRVVYESGKRDGENPAVRLAYHHEGLAAFQRDNGSLRPALQLAGRTFVIFAQPSVGASPAIGTAHVLTHPYGIAEVDGTSQLVFGDGAHTPVMRDGAAVPVSLDELRAAVD